MNETHDYDDIIYLKRPISKKHPPMNKQTRAMQFAPFSALTKYAEAIKETERLTEKKKIIDEDDKSLLDEKMFYLMQHIEKQPLVSVTYFVADSKKQGGQYKVMTGRVKKIDLFTGSIVFNTKEKINFQDIIAIYEEEREW